MEAACPLLMRHADTPPALLLSGSEMTVDYLGMHCVLQLSKSAALTFQSRTEDHPKVTRTVIGDVARPAPVRALPLVGQCVWT